MLLTGAAKEMELNRIGWRATRRTFGGPPLIEMQAARDDDDNQRTAALLIIANAKG